MERLLRIARARKATARLAGSGAAEAGFCSCADDDVVDDRAPWPKVAARAWPLVLVNCVAGLGELRRARARGGVAAARRSPGSGWAALPTYASITYYVASPFGFGLARVALGVRRRDRPWAVAVRRLRGSAGRGLAAAGLGAGGRVGAPDRRRRVRACDPYHSEISGVRTWTRGEAAN